MQQANPTLQLNLGNIGGGPSTQPGPAINFTGATTATTAQQQQPQLNLTQFGGGGMQQPAGNPLGGGGVGGGSTSISFGVSQPASSQPANLTINTSSNQQQNPLGGQPPATGLNLQGGQGTATAPKRPANMKSFRFILSSLSQQLQSLNFKGVDSLIRVDAGPDAVKNLQQCLLYFKSPQQGENSTRKKVLDVQNPLIWGGKNPLTPRLANELVIKLSELLNLDELLTFDLLESYFLTNESTRKLLVYIITIDMNITSAESQIPMQQNAMQNLQLLQRGLKNIDTWKSEFNNVVQQAIHEAQIIYFQERTALLQIILAVLSNPGTKERQPSALIKDLLQASKLEDNLLESLKRNRASIETFAQLSCPLREIIVSLQREEILILSCLIKIYSDYETPKVSQIIEFLRYQQQTRFRGLRLRPHEYQTDVTVQVQAQKITSLAVQQYFNYLQLQEFTSKVAGKSLTSNERLKKFIVSLVSKPQDFKELVNMIEALEKPLEDVDAVIYITFRQVCDAIVKLDLLTAFGQGAQKNLLQFDRSIRNEELSKAHMIEFISYIRQGEQHFDQEPSTSNILALSFGSQSEQLQLLVQDWINLVYPFFKAQKMEESIALAQDITFQVICQPSQLKYVWSQIVSSQNGDTILGMKGGLGRPPAPNKVIYTTIDIFENILENPFDMQNQGKFFNLMKALCGDKRHPCALEVLNLLQTSQMSNIPAPRGTDLDQNIGGGWSVLQYLVKLFIDFTGHLENDRLSTKGQQDFLMLLHLLGKMLSQSYLVYPEMTSESIALVMDLESLEENLLIEKPRQDSLRRNEPILYQLFQAFYVIIQKLPLEASTDALTSVMNALTTIYSNLDLQPQILSQISECKNYSGIPLLLEFFIFNLNENETKVSLRYKLTRSFLRFLNAVLKQSGSSIGYLENAQRGNLGESLIEKMIQYVYQTIYQNFVKIQFKDIKDFLKIYTELLKTTKTILKKFADIPAQMKVGVCHKYPQYDEILRILTDCLNGENLEFLLINSIMLSEQQIKSHSSGITNKFWVEHLSSSSTGSAADASSARHDDTTGKTRLLVQQVISQGLKCLNLILQLSFTGLQSEDAGVQIGAKHYYSRKLKCVENITNLVKYPGQWELYPIQTSTSSVSYSLFNIVSYYVKPHLHLCPFMTQVQIESIVFFTLCCRIWEVQPVGERVSLESTLRTTNIQSQEIRMKFVTNFKSTCKSLGQALPMQWLIQFFDLLITCCATQSQFVNDIFKEADFAQVFSDEFIKKSMRQHLSNTFGQGEINPAVKALASAIESRVIILLSEMANNKVNEAFLRKLSEGDDHARLQDNIIKPCLTQFQQMPHFDYQGEIPQNRLYHQSIQAANNTRCLNVVENCSAYLTVRYYLRLLQDEYQRDISSQGIKKAIRLLFENPNFVQHGLKSQLALTQVMARLQKINQVLASDERPGVRHLIRDFCANIESRPGKVTQEQIDMMASVDNKLVTGGDDCPVYLNQSQIDLGRLHQWLVRNESKKPYQMLQSGSSDLFDYEGNHGAIGPEFCINIDEFFTIAKMYFYDNGDMLAEVRSASASFNLAVSHYYAYQVFVSGLSDFLVEVGKSRMRDNMRTRELVLENRALCTSLYNLVVSEQIVDVIKTPGTLAGTQNRLAKLLIDLARPMAKKLQMPTPPIEYSTVFEQAQTQIELDLLSVILGSLNAAAETGDYSKEILRALETELITPMLKGLPKLRQKVNMPAQSSAQQGVLAKYQQQDRIANKMFINLVLQIFNLSIQFEGKGVEQVMNMSQLQQANELDYIQILSQVVKIMQDPLAQCFIEGLKIIETCFNLISSESVVLFMHRTDMSTLKVIVNKFLQAATTLEEKVKIVEFLTIYARIDQGADHMHQENILKSMGITQLVQLVNQIDFYLLETGDQEARRNPVHVLWCQVLLLIRTLNHLLMSESADYRKSVPLQISYQWSRMQALLEFGMHLKEQRFDHKAVSLALYEELELMTGIVQQYFDFTDELYQIDYEKYVDIKDRLLFGVLHLFVQEFPSTVNSATEKYLQGMTHEKLAIGVLRPGKYTGLDLAIDSLKVRIYFNTVSALLNACVINQNKASRDDLINTWDPQQKNIDSKRMRGSQGSYIQSQFYNPVVGAEFENFRSLAQLSAAVANINAAQQSLSQAFKFWVGSTAEQPLSQLHSNIQKVLLHDEWINNEYMGLNNYFGGPSFPDILDQFESALSMSFLVSGMLLAKLKESYDNADQAGYLQYQSAVTMKNLIDLGEQIVNDYRSFESEIKRVASTKPDKIARVSEQGKTIENFIDKMRRTGPQYGGGGTSTFRGEELISRDKTQFSKYR